MLGSDYALPAAPRPADSAGPALARPVEARRRQPGVLPIGSATATLLALELVARAGWLSDDVLPRVSDVARQLSGELTTGGFWGLAWATTQGWGAGLAAAAGVGSLLGGVLGLLPNIGRLLSGVIEFVRPIPSVALIPLAIIALGTGMETKIALVFVGSLWPVVIHTMLGIRSVDAVADDTARSFQVPLSGRILRLVVPTALPQFFTGLRVASAVALIVAVTVELVVGAPGLGREVNAAQQSGNTDLMYAYIVVVGFFGWATNAVFEMGEKRALHWHVSVRRARR